MNRLNIKKISSLLLLALVVVFLSACGRTIFQDKDNAEKPKKLVKFKETLQIKRLWERDTGGGVGKLTLRLKPAVDSGLVYSADHRGRVTAVKLKSGDKVWSVDLKKSISSGPSVQFGKVVVGTSSGEVIALNAKSGKIYWTSRVSSEVLSAPAIGSSVVVVQSIDGVITGLHGNSGKQVWRYKRQAPKLTIRGSSAPVIEGSRVYAGFDNGKIACLNLNSGRLLWERSVTAVRGRTEIERLVDIDTDPVVKDGILYVSTYQGKLAAISTRDVQILWTRKMSSIKSLAVGASNVYVTDEHSQVWAFDRNSGVSVWKQVKMRARKLTGPVIHGDYIVVADYDGYLHWLHRADGRLLGRYRGDSRGYIEAPIVIDDVLVALGKSGELTALKVKINTNK